MTETTEHIVTGWAGMWLLALALWVPLKVAGMRAGGVGRRGLAAWFAWPGTDAVGFFGPVRYLPVPWAAVGPFARFLGGALLVWGGARFFGNSLAAGWIGMVGIILLLHFGLFDLLSLHWRRRGFGAEPLMRAPSRATSLAEFWGRRWNTGFSIPARRWILMPLAPRIGVRAAGFLVFVVSGIAHEIVITIAAGGGYGLPTRYFVLQGLAAQFEKTRVARRLGLGKGAVGWVFTMLVVIGPVGMLFPPVFVRNVILPMLEAIGAMGGTV